jgi:hypothetical protein
MCRTPPLLEDALVRTRSALISLALTILLLASGAAPSAALSERAATARAVPGKVIAAPALDAIVKRLPVRVAVRLPANATTLRVRVGRRNVSGRFEGSGSLRVAHLGLGDGLRYGQNHLKVLVERRSGRPLIHAQSFSVVRHYPQLAQVRVRPGPVTSMSVRVPQVGKLATIRRTRFARLWVNGRPAHRAVDHSLVTRYTAKLSASQGLRYGVNRVRVMVTEPDAGRYVEVRRRFRIKRTRHLAAAGWDVDTRADRFVQLDGRRSRTAGGGKPRHSWRIVRKPRGSRAKLRRAGTARPSITPDRAGRYVIGLSITEPRRRAAASQDTPASDDSMQLIVAPARPLLAFKGLARQNNQNGILVGDTFYPNTSPNGAAMQWLTLQRNTLQLANPSDNNWLDGTGSGDHGIPKLTAALKNQGTNQLVILSYPFAGGPGPPVQDDQMDAFNAAMNFLGVGKISADILRDHNKLAILGIPKAGEGTGWYTHGGGPVEALKGWLMTDQVAGYRFQPDRPKFETQASHTGTTNTMNLAGQQFTASLPPGATGGFQVQFLNPIDFNPQAQDVFATNGVADPIAEINRMTAYLNGAQATPHLVVQSIGTVGRPAPPSDPYEPDRGYEAWTRLGQALTAFGANPNTFHGVNGAYAFFGGVWLDRGEVAESSTGVITDPTTNPHTTQAGSLQGRLSIRSDGYVIPAAADPHDKLSYELYDIAFQAPQPWKYTQTSGEPHYQDYDKAMKYITKSLSTTKKGWGNDLRVIYAQDLTRDWTTERDDLAILPYPADQLPCSQPRGRDRQPNPGFTKEQYCALVSQLRDEMAYLKSVKTLFDAYKDTLNQSGAEGQVDLQSIGRTIHDDVAGQDDEDLAAEIGNFILMLFEAAGLFISVPEGAFPVELALIEALAASYEFSMSMTAEQRSGVPLSDQVDTKVASLAADVAGRLTRSAASLDTLREIVASDWGRLERLGKNASTPGWVVRTNQLHDYLTTGANGYFTTELMPVAYNAWYLSPTFSWSDVKPDSCFIWGYGHSWKDSDVTNWWLNWQVPFDGQSDRGGSLLALGKKTWKWTSYAYPPDTLTEAFDPMTKGGYGVQLEDFIWEQYKAPYPSVSCYT